MGLNAGNGLYVKHRTPGAGSLLLTTSSITVLPRFEYLYNPIGMQRAACRNQIMIRRVSRYVKPSAPDVAHRAYERRC